MFWDSAVPEMIVRLAIEGASEPALRAVGVVRDLGPIVPSAGALVVIRSADLPPDEAFLAPTGGKPFEMVWALLLMDATRLRTEFVVEAETVLRLSPGTSRRLLVVLSGFADVSTTRPLGNGGTAPEATLEPTTWRIEGEDDAETVRNRLGPASVLTGFVGAPALVVATDAVVFAVAVDRAVAVVLTLVTEGAGLGEEAASRSNVGRVPFVSSCRGGPEIDLGAMLVPVRGVRVDGVGLVVASARGLRPAPIDTVEPCRAAVGDRACGPVMLLEGVGRVTDLVLPTDAEEAELLNRRRLRPVGSGGVVERAEGCRVDVPARRAADGPARAARAVPFAGLECG